MVNSIKISQIDANNRVRPVDPAHAEVIAASVAEVGLKQPIVVRCHPENSDGYQLVIGAHRLYAVGALLGWNELKVGRHVVIDDLDDNAARLAEIDENLARHELNALDRALFLAERKRLYLEINPEAGRGKAKKFKDLEKGQTLASYFSRSFARATAERIGLSKSAINMAIQLVEKLDPEAIAALRGTSIETNQRELFSLSALDPFSQRQVAGAIRQGQAKTTTQALLSLGLSNIPPVSDPQDRFYAVAIDAWSKMDKVKRAQFCEAADLIPKTAAPAKGPKK